MFKVKYDYFRGINRAKLIREIQYDKKRQEFLAIAQKKNKVVSASHMPVHCCSGHADIYVIKTLLT